MTLAAGRETDTNAQASVQTQSPKHCISVAAILLAPLGGATVFKAFPRGRREWLQIKGSSIDVRLKDITDRKSFYYT